jgi:hypothetical protein
MWCDEQAQLDRRAPLLLWRATRRATRAHAPAATDAAAGLAAEEPCQYGDAGTPAARDTSGARVPGTAAAGVLCARIAGEQAAARRQAQSNGR